MGPLPLNIGKINRLAPAHVLAVCVVQCTSCTECELVQVVCTTDAAPIYIERMRICMAEHMAMGVSTTICYAALDDLLLTFKPYFVYLECKQVAVLTAGQLRLCYMHYGQVVRREYVIELHLCAFGRYTSLIT